MLVLFMRLWIKAVGGKFVARLSLDWHNDCSANNWNQGRELILIKFAVQ
jgi:hypothetical protein